MSPPLVIHVYHNPTGARLFAAPLVRRLTQEGLDGELWCDGGVCSWFGASASITDDVTTRYLPCDLSLNPLRSLIRLIRLVVWMERARPTVVHAHLLRSALLPLLAAWVVGVPKRIYHNHGLSHLGYRGVIRQLLRLLECCNRAAATHLLMVSHSNLDSAKADGLGDGGTVLANGSAVGIDIERFAPSTMVPAIRLAGRAQLGIPLEAVVFGYAGRAATHKGLDLLAQAWKRSRLAESGASILLAGVRESELRSLAGDVPTGMRCLGPIHDMPAFYAMCDSIVLSSRYEGFGYALLEGAAVGLPGIGSDVTGIRSAIVDCVTGLLVPHNDPSALAAAMIRLANDPALRTRLGRAARERVQRDFTEELVLTAMANYYRDVLKVTTHGPRAQAERLHRGGRPSGRGDPLPQRFHDDGGVHAMPGGHRLGLMLKRGFDFAAAALLLLLLSPVILVIAVLIRWRLGSPVVFRQVRPGLHGQPFTVLKFRSMREAFTADGRPLPDAERLTSLGRFLRRSSLDELPQLWCVLRGDMSLVGPRPLLMKYLPLYSTAQARRHLMRPGITGWAQVHGRNAVSWPEKFALDTWYIDHWSLWLDLRILLLTVLAVLSRRGVEKPGFATTEEFAGETGEDRPLRILLIANYAPSLIPFRGDLLRSLVRMGHEVTAVVPGPLGSLPEQLGAHGVRCEELPFERSGMSPFADLALLHRLGRLLGRVRPDLVLLYTIKPVLYGSLMATLRGVPRVVCVIPGLGYAFGGTGFARKLFATVAAVAYRAALARAERVFFLNQDDATLFLSHGMVTPERMVVIPGEGVDVTHYQPPTSTPEPASFLLIGRLLRAKGIAEYAEAARVLRQSHPQARCYLLGPADPGPDGIPAAELRQWVDEGLLVYLGETTDVRPVLARVGVLVLPSYREGLPRTVIEAMAMARAVVVTDVPGCRQTVSDGVNGLLVPARDPIALARAMARLIDDPALATRMGQEGRRLCEQVYDVRVVNRRICDEIGLHDVASGGIP